MEIEKETLDKLTWLLDQIPNTSSEDPVKVYDFIVSLSDRQEQDG